uniref:Coiled-coil and C2 domain-containing protein 1B n=1 Tax=Callorhinchus milii TaxID=7868 RepID=A0A4W3IWU4_CALMI
EVCREHEVMTSLCCGLGALGLFMDVSSEDMMLDIEGECDDGDLEAELAALTGKKSVTKQQPKGKAPLPMEHIEQMAENCMKDLDETEDDDDDLENDEELLVSQTIHGSSHSFPKLIIVAEATSGVQGTVEERIQMYKAAISKAKEAGETSKTRRYERGLKTLETMLTSVKKGKTINEAELPPPVAVGKISAAAPKADNVERLEDEKTNDTTALLTGRQKEYRLAALKAKQRGDIEKAKEFMKTSKKFDSVIMALNSGEPVDLRNLPPSPGKSLFICPPRPPKDILEALQQRMEKYKSAAAQAKAGGNDRKARMHERIAKQYQDVIRAHKAGRKVDFADLPIPPGFPPIPGVQDTGGNQDIAEVLEAASQLATAEVTEEDEDEEEAEGQYVLPFFSAAQLQLEFLENRKKLYIKAAIQAKQKKNLEQAKQFLRTIKGFDPMIEAVKSGKPIDISKVPSPPDDDEDDFIMVYHKDVKVSSNFEEVYTNLMKLLREQYQKCLTYSKQFTHLGNVVETTKFEKMAASCSKNMEILKLAQAQGLNPPKHHFEERSFQIVRIFSDLSSTEMLLIIVKGINLPAPPGKVISDSTLTEQAPKFKTNVIKNTNCPEYNQSFKLNINRNHRGFKRVIQSKGIKFEIIHKGGFLRCDKPVGTAQLKLDKLETECEVREIIEIFDGRKSTGGRLEVKAQIREPLSGQDLQMITEKWLVLDTVSTTQIGTSEEKVRLKSVM